MRGFYRWHLMDPICFEENLKVTIQQIGVCYKGLFERQDDVASVAYWYQSEPHQAFKPLMNKKEMVKIEWSKSLQIECNCKFKNFVKPMK